MVWLEIQEGKDCMKDKEFNNELGIFSDCVIRGVEATSECVPIPVRTKCLDNPAVIEDEDNPGHIDFSEALFF